MKRSVTLALLAVLLLVALLAAQPLSRTEEVLDAPGGHPIAILLPGTSPRVVQEEGGYAKVVVEGWMRVEQAGPAAPGTPPAPEAPPRATPAPSSVTGRIQVRLPSKEVRYGAGARVMLLGRPDELEARRAALVASYQKEVAALREKAGAYEAAKRQALNSSDNLSRATKNLDQAKSDLARNAREIEQVQEKYEALEETLLQEFKVCESTADPSGDYRLQGFGPGAYRLRAWFTDQGSPYRWYVPVQVLADQSTPLDLMSSKAGEDAFLTLP